MLTNRSDYPADPAFADLVEALAPEHALPLLQAHLPREPRAIEWTACRVIEALYDPGRQICVAYMLASDPELPVERAWPEGEIAYVRYPVRRPMSRRGTLCRVAGRDVELYRFPNDRRLRTLRRFTQRETVMSSLRHWIGANEPAITLDAETLKRSMVRYVPEQKLIVYCRARGHDALKDEPVKRGLSIRATAPSVAREIYQRNVALRKAMLDAEGAFQVARPVALDTARGLLALKWTHGRSLLEELQAGSPDEIMSQVAKGLHRLHHAPLPLLERATSDTLLAEAAACAGDIQAVLPSLKKPLEAVLEHLSESMPQVQSPVTVHRDFHFKQLLSKNGQLFILDLEQCRQGDPWLDVGTFAAQLSVLPLRSDVRASPREAATWYDAFLGAWQRVSARTLDAMRVRWYSAIALLTLGRGMLRHLRPGWPDLVQRLVMEAANRLDVVEQKQGFVRR